MPNATPSSFPCHWEVQNGRQPCLVEGESTWLEHNVQCHCRSLETNLGWQVTPPVSPKVRLPKSKGTEGETGVNRVCRTPTSGKLPVGKGLKLGKGWGELGPGLLQGEGEDRCRNLSTTTIKPTCPTTRQKKDLNKRGGWVGKNGVIREQGGTK